MPEETTAAVESPTEPERHSVTYELMDRDAAAACLRASFHHPLLRRKFIPAITFLAVVGFVFLCWQGGWIGPVSAVLGLSIFYMGIVPRLLARQARANPGFRGPHTLVISPDAIGGETHGVGETRVFWWTVVGIGSTPEHLMFFWQSGATTIVPRRAFETPQDADRFLATAERWRDAAISAATGGSRN